MTSDGSLPVHGLPEALPAGEAVLWQGAPRWGALARHAFFVRPIAYYFVALALWRGATALWVEAPTREAVLNGLWLLGIGAIAVGLLVLFAFLVAESTVYTITNRRVVFRIGVALTMDINIPYRIIESAGLKTYPGDSGDITLRLGAKQRIAYAVLWPHVRPWSLFRAEPLLRSVPDAIKVADILAGALAAAAAEEAQRAAAEAASAGDGTPVPARTDAPQDAGARPQTTAAA